MTTARIELPPKLIPVFDGPADVRGAYGGRGSAKTRSFAKMMAVRGYMYGMSGIRGQLVCARQFMNSLEDSSLEEVKRAIEDEPWLLDYYEIGEKYVKSKDGNVWFTFIGLDRNIQSVKSKGRILVLWIDEAEPVSDDAFSIVIPTLREEGEGWNAELWVTWNPRRAKAPVERRFRYSKDALVKCVELNWRDNPKFPAKLERERQRDLADNPDTYEHVWEGKYIKAVAGAIYVEELLQAEKDGRIDKVPYDPRLKVHVVFDLGYNDAMAVGLVQKSHGQTRVIKAMQWTRTKLEDISVELKGLRLNGSGMNWGTVFLPHDGDHGDYKTGLTTKQLMGGLGWNAVVLPTYNGAVESGIRKVRSMFPRVAFDKDEAGELVESLGQYRRAIPTTTGEPGKPVHDEHSHYADMFRYVAEAEAQMSNDDYGSGPVSYPKLGIV